MFSIYRFQTSCQRFLFNFPILLIDFILRQSNTFKSYSFDEIPIGKIEQIYNEICDNFSHFSDTLIRMVEYGNS